MTTSVVGVAGSVDGMVPVYDPNGRWTIWSLKEIFTGTVGAGRYVPKVDDYVLDPSTYTTYIVRHVDPITLLSELQEIRPANMSLALTETDVLFGVGPGTQADTYRVYVDKSVYPYVMSVDCRLKVAGTMTQYARIFRGAALDGAGEVVSRMYDASGNPISDKVTLEVVADERLNNYSIKIVPVCYTTADLPDNEVVTAVFYSDAGIPVSKRQLLVENTAFIRQASAEQKFISHIHLESPFLSQTSNSILEFPLNVPVSALSLMGVVTYSDGSTLKLPVDGSKFRLLGLDQYVSTIVGQTLPLVLSYSLSPTEAVYGAVSGDGKYITEPYMIQTVEANNSYSVKIFGYPVFISTELGYQMQWFLFNLDRNLYFDVTPYVKFAQNTGAFNPKGYGYLQRKAITLNLRDVDGSFKPFTHTQLVDIILDSPPNGKATPWQVSHESVSERPMFGDKVYATKAWAGNSNVLNISSGFASQADWLTHLYSYTYPLVDRFKELNPPTPTHFEIISGSNKLQFSIDDWNKDIGISFDPAIGSTLFIRFYKQTAAGQLQLSMAAMIVASV